MQWQKMKLPFLIVKEAYLDHGQHGTLKKTIPMNGRGYEVHRTKG